MSFELVNRLFAPFTDLCTISSSPPRETTPSTFIVPKAAATVELALGGAVSATNPKFSSKDMNASARMSSGDIAHLASKGGPDTGAMDVMNSSHIGSPRHLSMEI